MIVRTAILVDSEDTVDTANIAATVLPRLRQSLGNVVVLHQQFVTSQQHWVEELLRRWCDEEDIDLVLTIGGTFPAPGPSNKDILPEATAAIIERLTPSLPEVMRSRASVVNTDALLDRGIAGIRGRTLIVNLPGQQDLTKLFLDIGSDPIASILRYLQPDPTTEDQFVDDGARRRSAHKLDAAEFAEFLRERQNRKGV